jgi:NAD-dependent deacetylase
MSESIEESARRAAAAIAKSGRILAFTGAGISVESGIPPFRGEGGVWNRYDPSLLELSTFLARPKASWEAIREIFYESFGKAQPNAAHRVLARWEEEGRLDFLVTQNIDGLHRAAGSKRLAEFHGAMGELACTSCGTRYPASRDLLEDLPPSCPSCGGLLKPDFVFFGEGIPAAALESAFAAAERADLCIVVGSTGTVYPAASVPLSVKRRGGILVEVDPGETEFSPLADIHVRAGASEALEKIDMFLRKGT